MTASMTVGALVDVVEAILVATVPAVRDGHASLDHAMHPSREARELVAAMLDVAPAALRSMRDQGIAIDAVERVQRAAARRAHGEPLAYCTGSAAFRHLVLDVDARVLIPRPETEVVAGEALSVTAHAPGGIAVDIGTGSGAIALSLASEGAFDRVIATDISSDALDVARHNVRHLPPGSAPLEFRQGSDLAPLQGIRARVLVSNPPYIAFSEASSLPAAVRDWEPPTALFAADEGMARYSALLAGAPDYLEPGGWLVLEVDARRARDTAALASASGRYASIRLVQDLTGRERVLVARAGDPVRRPTS